MTKEIWKDDPLGEEAQDAEISAMLEQLGVEKAPARLTRRLMRIPEEEGARRQRWSWPKFRILPAQTPPWFRTPVMAPALAAVPLAILAVVLLQPRQPSDAEIEQARQDLAVAFAYLDKAGYRAGHEIQAVLGGELRHSVKDTLSRHMPFTEQSSKEETS